MRHVSAGGTSQTGCYRQAGALFGVLVLIARLDQPMSGKLGLPGTPARCGTGSTCSVGTPFEMTALKRDEQQGLCKSRLRSSGRSGFTVRLVGCVWSTSCALPVLAPATPRASVQGFVQVTPASRRSPATRRRHLTAKAGESYAVAQSSRSEANALSFVNPVRACLTGTRTAPRSGTTGRPVATPCRASKSEPVQTAGQCGGQAPTS